MFVPVVIVKYESNRSFHMPPFPPGIWLSFKCLLKFPLAEPKSILNAHHMSILGYQMPTWGKFKKVPHFSLLCSSFQMLLRPILQTGCIWQHSFYSIILWFNTTLSEQYFLYFMQVIIKLSQHSSYETGKMSIAWDVAGGKGVDIQTSIWPIHYPIHYCTSRSLP